MTHVSTVNKLNYVEDSVLNDNYYFAQYLTMGRHIEAPGKRAAERRLRILQPPHHDDPHQAGGKQQRQQEKQQDREFLFPADVQ